MHDKTRRALLVAMAAGIPTHASGATFRRSEGRYSNEAESDGAMAASSNARPEALRRQPNSFGVASVRDFGAVGDGSADDSPAFTAAIAASQYLFVPPGRYRFGSTVKLRDQQLVLGGGKSAWEPYKETGPFPDVSRSEIVVDGIRAFDASGTNSCCVEGLAIKSVGGRQSRWGAPAGLQRGAVGIDITGSTQFEARNLSFHGLEVAIDANQASGSADTQMPSISDWAANDCGTVFRFGNSESKVYTVRDAHIATCVAAVHCDRMIDAHRCDGLRLENLRLFQCIGKSIYIRETPFVIFSAVTVFETGDDQVTLKDCPHVSLAGLLLARAGAYKGARPYAQHTALTLEACHDVFISGEIQQSTGRAINISECSNVCISAAIGTPFWTTGNLNNIDGAIRIGASEAVNIQASFGGLGRDYWASVWADPVSQMTLSGSISSNRSIGVVRATALQKEGAIRFSVEKEIKLARGETAEVATIRAYVPTGKSLRSRLVEINALAVELTTSLNVDGKKIVWTATSETIKEGDREIAIGSISFEDKPLFINTGDSGWYSIKFALRNRSPRELTVPVATEIRISTVLI